MIDNATSKKRGSWKSRMVSAFDVAAKPVKELARDSRTQDAFAQMEGDVLLENSGAVLKRFIAEGGAKNAVSTGFLQRYQQILSDKKLKPDERKRMAAKLDREINDYASSFAADRQIVHALRNSRDQASAVLERVGVQRFNEVKPLFAELAKGEEILQRLADKLERQGRLDPEDARDVKLADAMLGGINSAGLSSFTTPAQATARSMAIEQKAITDPNSDAGRLVGALGVQLRARAAALFQREADKGMDFKKLGEHAPLSDEELLGIYVYTDFDYEAMNTLLITGGKSLDAKTRSDLQIKIDLCKRGLSKLPSYPTALYPVVRWENDSSYWREFYKVNQVFRNMQFWSTGATAGAQIKQPTPLQLIFRVYGLSGKDIAMLSSKKGEGANKDDARPEAYLKNLGQGEVLFTPGTPFKVMSISEEPQGGGKTKVYITVMEQPQ